MPDLVEVVIDSIRVGLMSQQRVVILREVDAEIYLAIWIDPYMAEQITFALQEVEVARPMTHDLMRELLHTMKGRVVRVEVLSLKGDVFFGNIVVEVNNETVDIDSRPSDALALAVRTHVPIMVSSEVMESAGIIPEDDLDENGVGHDGDVQGEGEERLEVFEDFLDNLEIDEEDDNEGGEAKNN